MSVPVENQAKSSNEIDLSTTLVERRKRLHELAYEINQWEDEAIPSKCVTTPVHTSSFDLLANKQLTPTNYCSPKQPHCHVTITKQSPIKSMTQLSPYNYNRFSSSGCVNKENSPLSQNVNKRKLIEPKPVQSQSEEIDENSKLKSQKLSIDGANDSLVKNMKTLFENNSSSNMYSEQQLMTPRNIIKKFEALSQRELSVSASASKLRNTSSQSVNTIAKRHASPLVPCITSETFNKKSEANCDQAESFQPKLIIEKFESLVKNQQQEGSNEFHRKSADANYGNGTGAASLTYISSMVSSTRTSRNLNDSDQNTMFNEDENEQEEEEEEEEEEEVDDDEEEFMSESESEQYEDGIYEEIGTYKQHAEESTSLFDEKSDVSNQYESEEIEETQDIELAEEDRDMAVEKISSSNKPDSNDVQPPKPNQKAIEQLEEAEPLYSIKEYRKQKKNFMSGGSRRSSISGKMLQANQTMKSKMPSAKPLKALQEDNKVKKAKNIERIKELEDLIRQEDNVIHQTGIALESCRNQTQFIGSSEHIECNRLLLVSCQKRQAYLTEISRLKQLSNSNLAESQRQNEESDETESGLVDLTGTLIFSDIQLPIKESYLSKLKSGEEKRFFYFICLVRNGVQVLQTQVISVQELISTRDTIITFPNRMAINNVDVNFKVKIDVYTLEMLPKESKNNKHGNATQKFFSPLKNTVLHTFSLHSGHGHGQAAGNTGHTNSSLMSSSGKTSSNKFNNSSTSTNHYLHDQSNLGAANGATKTSNFIHVDTIEITTKDLNKNKFKLSISSSSIPLSGLLFVKVRCTPSKSIELRGFLTIFEDLNGYGSWDRRWCLLNNYSISYWKYPEDEYRNTPIGVINLNECTNDTVKILPRDLCARKYTIELSVLSNETKNGSDDTKVQRRYRLSADTKDQVNDWMIHINWAIKNLRIWNPPKSA